MTPRIARVAGTLAMAFALIGCGSGSDSGFDSMDVVHARLERHELSDGTQQFFELIGAYDGWAYLVTPGGFQVEIYLYRDRSRMVALENLPTARSDLERYENIGVLFFETSQTQRDAFMEDLRD